MTCGKHALALGLAAVLLGGCQLMPMGGGPVIGPRPMGSAIDGNWMSGDGLSVTSFQGGTLATRFVGTNELVAQGTYTVQGNRATMNFLSIRSQENRSAVCTIGSAQLNCSPPSGPGFTLNRV